MGREGGGAEWNKQKLSQEKIPRNWNSLYMTGRHTYLFYRLMRHSNEMLKIPCKD